MCRNGVAYRVLDCVWRIGARVFANLPATWGTTTSFRPANGRWRLYPLGLVELHPEWTWEPTPEMLAILLAHPEPGVKATVLTLADRVGPGRGTATWRR